MEEKKATTNSEQKKKFKKPYKKKPAKKENQAKVEKEVKENKNTKQPKQNQKANKPKSETKKNDQKNNVSSKAKSKTESKKKFETKNKSILDFHFKPSKLKIIALGGLDEIGKNITVFEYENDMIIVDCGIEFPDDDMLGVDLVIPDFSYIVKNIDRCKGLFITHGHEDHIGSIPYLLKEVNIPIYGTKLTMKLIQHKLEEHHLMQNADLHVVEQGDIIDTGKMQVEFIRSSHSIPDSCMLAIHSPAGVVLHTGDFKVDYTPIDGQMMDLGRIAELGKEGVLAMLSDSTNAERKGFTLSEKSIGPIFDNLIEGCKKRIEG
jgi:ribonuclease J